MIKIGSLQSNDLLVEYSPKNKQFALVNTVSALDNDFIKDFLEKAFTGINLPLNHLKVYFCGANQWVVKARGLALREKINEEHDAHII
ncbi:MAG: hypothetical protein GY757_01325 [bacterium]|nr:hypothetical protein [bacterium]